MADGMRIAVLGAGYVGSALARAAAADRRNSVCAVRRRATVAATDGVTWLSGDITAGDVAGMPRHLDAVVLTVSPSRASDAYDAIYPPAATAAVTLARITGARTLIYTSSTGVYGGRDGAWVTESSLRLGTGAPNMALIAAEDIVLNSGLDRVTVLRVSGIYGPGRDPRERMRVAEALPERGQYWANLAHRDDIVSAILHVLTLAHPPTVLNVSDGAPRLAADICRWITTASGGDAEALTFSNDGQRSRNNQRVSNQALAATGWAPKYPSFREGFTFGL